MDRPTIKHQDTDDSDFEYDGDLEDENECPECGCYKNFNRKMCDACIYANK